MSAAFEALIKRYDYHPVIPAERQYGQPLIVDLTPESEIWQKVSDGHDYAQEIKRQAAELQATVEVGRYAEERLIYQETDNFVGQEARTLHIGIDLGIPAGNPVYAPLEGCVLGFGNDPTQGSYGPSVVLRHELEGQVFHTLYGHLSVRSLAALSVGQEIGRGEAFAAIGSPDENGGWPPHLHFQLIRDMQGHTADYVGVVDPQYAEFYLDNCPDPNWILNMSL
ncbi:peptidoglycan DD-metalloendopeptidase family protein [Vibrio zhugei]|uniref:Peptidoglycan DD-metalloendopeptidase family protein n=1 Tax=Vibrio zhugei TaxID=2479546 RepID=A0ABV7CAN4_9VIBR|nr:peptidoglycan DD-metalloendopeptidase family protein [Vibrio zhugei]